MLWTNVLLIILIITLIIHGIAIEKDQNAIAKGMYKELDDIKKSLHEIRETLWNINPRISKKNNK